MKNIYEAADEYSKLDQAYSKLDWAYYTTGYDFGCKEAYSKIVAFLSSDENFDIVQKAYNDSSLNTKQKRESEIMYKTFEPFHLSKEVNELSEDIEKLTNQLSQILNNHRSKLNGEEISSVDIDEILSNCDDREKRKAAFLARAQVNKPLVDGGFVELIKLRKEYAKKRGFKNFVEMRLSDDELTPEIFKSWTDDVHKILPKMNEVREKAAKKYLNDTVINPWDEAYVSSKIAPSLNKKVDMTSFYTYIKNLFLKFGVDISKFNLTYDIFSRANKSEWGYNFPIAAGKDSRILANVKNQYREYNVLLHETGHGVHSFLLNPDEVILNMGISGIIEEGIANLFGNFVYEKIFYKDFFDETSTAEEEFKNLKNYSKVNSLRTVDMILFDQGLYLNDNINSLEDINDFAFKIHKDVLNEDRYADEFPWGYRIHHTTHPIYLHNYLMGDVTCEMLKKAFCKKYGCSSVEQKPLEFMTFLKDSAINPSGFYKYTELFRRISGEDFSLKFML